MVLISNIIRSIFRVCVTRDSQGSCLALCTRVVCVHPDTFRISSAEAKACLALASEFVSFDKQAVALLKSQGKRARLLAWIVISAAFC